MKTNIYSHKFQNSTIKYRRQHKIHKKCYQKNWGDKKDTFLRTGQNAIQNMRHIFSTQFTHPEQK